VNDYPPIQFEIRFERKFLIVGLYFLTLPVETLKSVPRGKAIWNANGGFVSVLLTHLFCIYIFSHHRLTKQPKLTAIIQSRRLTLFGHIMRMDDNTDAKRILLASPPADWRRQPGRPRIMWLSTVQQDLKQHHLTLLKTADLAQNRPLWRMMSTYGATQS